MSTRVNQVINLTRHLADVESQLRDSRDPAQRAELNTRHEQMEAQRQDLVRQSLDSPGGDVVRWALDIHADTDEAAQARAALADRIRAAAAEHTATHGRDDDAHGR